MFDCAQSHVRILTSAETLSTPEVYVVGQKDIARHYLHVLQAHNVQLGLAEMTVVACTATLAAIGAAAIPSAGLVTMLMVMQAVSLDQFASDLAVILAIDWLLDRCRTAVNIMGDTFGVVLIDSMCRQVAKHDSAVHASPSRQTLEIF